jgi:hypothetical protein
MHHVVLTFGLVSLLSSLSGTEDTQCGVDIAPSKVCWSSGDILARFSRTFYCDFLLWIYPKVLLFSGLVVACGLKKSEQLLKHLMSRGLALGLESR